MRIPAFVLALAICAGLASGCTGKSAAGQRALKQPVNCSTAQGDLRVLEAEKVHLAEQIAIGATAILPAGAVIGILTGTEDDKLEVAVGEYDRKLDAKIAEIKRTCGIR